MACGAAFKRSPAVPASLPKLESERKLVTVLFADICNSFDLIAGLDPEQAESVLAELIGVMKSAIHRFEGTLTRTMGDGIMALFGAPLALEDHALRACCAALEMQEQVKQLARRGRQASGSHVMIRVGLNSGEVLVRTAETDVSTEYDAAGDVVHLASRMEQAASPGSVLLTAFTAHLVEGQVEVRVTGPKSVRGLAEPVQAFELVSATLDRRRLMMDDGKGLTPFVNRQEELTILRRAFDRAAGSGGQVVGIVGEAGSGKSRLLHEFMHSGGVADCQILETRCPSYGARTGFGPFSDLIQSHAAIGKRDTTEVATSKLAAALDRLGLDPAKSRLPLSALCNLSVDESNWSALEPGERRVRIVGAIVAFLEAISGKGPTILVIDDVHWADEETRFVLNGFVQDIAPASLLVLLGMRSRLHFNWQESRVYTELRLGPLNRTHALALLRTLVAPHPLLESLEKVLMERTGGNPFFIEESLQALVQEQVLLLRGGLYHFSDVLPRFEVPATVRSVLAARIDRLGSRERSVLQAASTIGREVPLALLRSIAGFPDSLLHACLLGLQRDDFLQPLSQSPEVAYVFRHALIQEVAYAGMLIEKRSALHAQIVEALEELYPERLADHLEQLVEHAMRGRKYEKAVEYGHLAGRKAAARDGNQEAKAFFELALSATAHLPPSTEISRQAVDLHFELRNPLFRLGELRLIGQMLERAEPIASRLDDTARLGQLYVFQSHIHWLFGNHGQALEASGRASSVAAERGDSALAVRARFQAGLIHLMLAQYSEAINAMQQTLDHLAIERGDERYGLDQPLAIVALSYLSRSFAEMGQFNKAAACVTDAVRLSETVNKPFSWIFAYIAGGYLCDRARMPLEGVPWLERALKCCEVADARLMVPPAGGFLGTAYVHVGRTSEAIDVLKAATEAAEQMGFMAQQPLRLSSLAQAHFQNGAFQEALQYVDRALELSRYQGERDAECRCLKLLGEMHLTKDPEVAVSRLSAACALARELAIWPFAAECAEFLATAEEAAGRPQAAQVARAASASYLAQCDRFIVDCLPTI